MNNLQAILWKFYKLIKRMQMNMYSCINQDFRHGSLFSLIQRQYSIDVLHYNSVLYSLK